MIRHFEPTRRSDAEHSDADVDAGSRHRRWWLEGVFVTRTSAAGIALEHGTIASSSGVLVAETFQTRRTG